MQSMSLSKRCLKTRHDFCHWLGWFILFNTALTLIVAIHFSASISYSGQSIINTYDTMLVWFFGLVAILGQSLLGMGTLLVIASAPCWCFLPTQFLSRIWLAIVAALGLFLFYADSVVFSLYHYHFNGVIWQMLVGGEAHEIFNLSNTEWWFIAILIVCIILAEMGAILLAQVAFSRRWRARNYFFSLLGCLVLAWMLYIEAVAHQFREIMDVGREIPYFTDTVALLTDEPALSQRLVSATNIYIEQAGGVAEKLNYPLHPMQCQAPNPPYNIVFLFIDTWRFDMLNAEVTPKLHAFAHKSQVFTQHYSGGNATGPGIFSLFYSLPYSYWTAMLQQKIPPIFMQLLAQYHYQMKILASAELKSPAFDKTVFINVKDLRVTTPGAMPYERDERITKDALSFLASRPANATQPYFLFLFYDAVHAIDFPPNFPAKFQPWWKTMNRALLTPEFNPLPLVNRYRNALNFVDGQAAQVLKAIDLRNTIVIVTGDHGEEFNDNHQNYWGHSSNFTHFQVQTPFIIYWPGQAPGKITSPTSHYDVIPSLLSSLFSCRNDYADYSIGQNLYKPHKLAPFFVGGYMQTGIVTEKQITALFPDGSYQVMTHQAKVLPDAPLNTNVIAKILQLTHKYFKGN